MTCSRLLWMFVLSISVMFFVVPSSRLQDLDVVFLDAHGLLDDALVGAGDLLGEEPLPLGVGERDVVQRLELRAQVGDELRLAGDRQVLVRLLLQELDELPLQLGLGLVRRLGSTRPDELGDDGALGARPRSARSVTRGASLMPASSNVSSRSR